ncbi:MAG: homoserine dehydrogenase [Chloroflexi bacterium]|nr:homoserine dehydrogenase [Chloroflexota bacterium]
MSRAPLRVAVLGAGTVGREVVRAILDRADRLSTDDGADIELVGIACRDHARARASGIPARLLTDAPAHLVASAETDVIVELMGGDEPAHTLIAAALSAGKPVVTANKHVIAHHGAELEATARRCRSALRFEAAVGGGIPILGLLASDLAANEISRVRGIVNGTTNYILTAMAHEGRPYEDILIDAQELGYAEADPSGDVEGDDAVNKLVILARLAFGRWLDPTSVVRCPPTARGEGRPGITGVTDQEMEGAAALGLTIKLIATTTTVEGGIVAAVLPTAVPADSGFGWIDGVANRFEIDADPLGTLRLAGPGAGGASTSSAVLGDLVAIARGHSSTWAGLPSATASTALAEHDLEAPRHWYAFVPPVAVDALPAALDEAAAVSFEDGAAVRSEVVPLTEARAAFAAILPPGIDVTLYPVDE